MNIDESFSAAQRLVADLSPRLAQIETEQDARFQMINRFLTEVLGWDFAEVKTEPHGPSGYTDYLLSHHQQSRAVIEAKRIETLLIDTLQAKMRPYKVGGPALRSCAPGIKQAAEYCLDHGVNYAVVTTGVAWVAFLPMPGAGISYREGFAFAFPNFESILEDFATFFDLFSREAVVEKRYGLLFAKAGGLSVADFQPRTPVVTPDDVRLLPISPLAADLDPVFKEFFGAMSANADRDMLIECFVETRESRFADASLEKLVRSVTANITELDRTSETLLTDEIRATVETGRGESVVIVGNNGAGKTTFIDRFFSSVLEPKLRAKCTVLRVDVGKSPGDVSSIVPWLNQQVRIVLESTMFQGGNPTFDELQGLYFSQYQRWMLGAFKPLYDSDKDAFKRKFSEYLDAQMEKDPYGYILRLLEDIVKNRQLLPCLVFDNGDQYSPQFKEAVFQYAQAIHQTVPYTFVVMPITDRSFWKLSNFGPFQTYPSKMFYLPVPPTKEVLEKRVVYLKRKLEENKDRHQYFLTRGIKLSVDNISGFAACLEEVFVKEDFISRRTSWLANNNLRKCLEIAQSIIISPYFSIDDLVKAYIAQGSGNPIRLNYRKFMQALVRGQYNVFQNEQNKYVTNVFDVSSHAPTTPLLALSLLKLLIDRAGDGGVGGYVSVEHCRQYLDGMGISEVSADEVLARLLGVRLIEPYDASDEGVHFGQRVAISHAGRMHYDFAISDSFYVSDMALVTPLRQTVTVETMRNIRGERMGGPEWAEFIRAFIAYCLDEDHVFARIPTDSIYDGQRALRRDLRGRWVELLGESSAAEVDEDKIRSDRSVGYSHVNAKVKWFDRAKGFGFVDAGLGSDAFVHLNVLRKSEIVEIDEGDTMSCDIGSGQNGKLQVIAVHGVQRAPSGESAVDHEEVTGVVEFYNEAKGYGFVKASGLSDDVYVSGKLVDSAGLTKLRAGEQVRVSVQPGRFGKGFMATSVQRVA